MGSDEKEIYSLIFTLTLKLSKKREFADFAKHMIEMCESYKNVNDDGFKYAWNLLKEYADLTTEPNSEERWKALVDSADDYARKHNDGMTRRMIGCVLAELERRSIGDDDR